MNKNTEHNYHPKYRPDIDGLRAIAILSVVIFHAFPSKMKGGYVGVDIFFVISGFLISSIIFRSLYRGDFSFIEFYVHRIKRIFPALIFVLVACLSFGWFVLFGDEFKQLGKHIAAGVGFVQNFVLWQEDGYFDNASELKPLMHLWSLAIEEQFYLIYPVVIWIVWRQGLSIFGFILVVGLLSFCANIIGVGENLVKTFFMPHTRFWELLAGALLAYFHVFKQQDNFKNTHTSFHFIAASSRWLSALNGNAAVNNLWSILGLLLIIASVFGINKGKDFPGWWAIIPVAGTFLLIASGPNAWVNRKILSNRVMVLIGLISYPLYLWHWPLIAYPRIIESETLSTEIRTIAVLVSFVLALLTYLLIEKPIRYGSKSWKKTSSLVVSMALVGYFGYSIYQMEGLPKRDSVKLLVNNNNELIRLPKIDDECREYTDNPAPSFPYCRYKNSLGDLTVAVIGDSHAHVAFPGVAEYLYEKDINTVLLANSGCPTLLGGEYGKNEREKELCKKRIEDILSITVDKEDITDVFIFTRGPVYWTGTEPKGTKKKPTIDIETYFSSLQRTVDYLVNAKKRVYYVIENPELKISPVGCIARPLRDIAKDCEPRLVDVESRFDEYLMRVNKINNAVVVNTIPIFCPDHKCKVFDDYGKLLYADDDHLSYSGSVYQLDKILKNYLPVDD